MRDDQERAGDAWPAGMTIRIEHPRQLLYLLFVREAWSFAPLGAPALDPPPDTGASTRPPGVTDEAALARWATDWDRAIEPLVSTRRAPRVPDAETVAALRDLSDAELVAWATRRPTEFWAAGVDEAAFDTWVSLCFPAPTGPLERTPERMSLPALVAAWRSGIRDVVELPFDGYCAERIGPTTLLVSAFTRSVPDLYTRALNDAAQD